MKIWAHRGASAYAPENTLEAFALAVEQRADGVELDVHMSLDGELIVCHDETINRVSDGSGAIGTLTLKQLKGFDFGARFANYRGAKCPTLGEVYELLKPSGLTVNVELKTDRNAYPGIELQCVNLARDMGMTERVIYSSFNHQSLRRVKEIDAAIPTGLLYGKRLEDTVAYAKAQDAQAIHPYYKLMYEEGLLDRVREAGIKVHPWTVDEAEEAKRFFDMGADALITDAPDVALRACGL